MIRIPHFKWFHQKAKLTLNVFKQLVIHEKSCFCVPLLFPPSLKTSTPRGEDLVTRSFCQKSDQMSLIKCTPLSNVPKLGQTSLSKCPTLGMASFVKPPNVARPPPLGLNIDRCITDDSFSRFLPWLRF